MAKERTLPSHINNSFAVLTGSAYAYDVVADAKHFFDYPKQMVDLRFSARRPNVSCTGEKFITMPAELILLPLYAHRF